MFKKYIHLFIWFITLLLTNVVSWADSTTSNQSQMLPGNNNWVIDNKLATGDWKDLDTIFSWVQDSIEKLLPIVAVWVFLFVGIRIALAKWNPEEFKKAWTHMAYAVIWIFIVGFAWAAVKLVSGLNI